jgi:hypothetical protein
MTNNERLVKQAYQRSGLALLGVTFAKAMQERAIRIALECAVKSGNKGKPAPIQPALI